VGNATTLVVLNPRALVSGDAAGLLASIDASTLFQPSMLLETDFTTAIALSGTISGDADIWRVLFAPPSKIPNTVFYPIAFRMTMVSTKAAFTALWALPALFSVDKETDGSHVYDDFTMGPYGIVFDGSGEVQFLSGNPVFHAYPTRPLSTVSDVIAENAVGALNLTIATFDATAAGDMALHVDARWLGFPRPVVRNAGFYTPRLFFKTN